MALDTFHPAGALEGLLAPLLRGTLKALLKPVFSPRWSIAAQRRWLGLMARLNLPPRGVRITPDRVAGVPGEWVRQRDGTPRRGIVLYLHGGAYCVGSPTTHRGITGALARGTGMAVFALDYRLAPEHPFPAALHDALAAVRALRLHGPVVLAGDSAGAGLALATALALRDAAEPGDGGAAAPAALLLMAPWVDATLARLPPPTPGEALLSRAWVAACAQHYLAGADAAQPGASPLSADLQGLPPVLIQVGTDDLLHDESLRLHDFVILEKSPGLGGTWWDNTYPGAQVDVPAPLYSYSFAPNPQWTRLFATAPEIQAYMRRVARHHAAHPLWHAAVRGAVRRDQRPLAAGHRHGPAAARTPFRMQHRAAEPGTLSPHPRAG